MKRAANLYLVGLMGAGKTTVGRVLARRLKLRFLDSDQEIERRCGVKIPVIFEIEGEAGFRGREAAVIGELSQLRGIVLATGGGVVIRPANRERLKVNGTVVYLRADPAALWERVHRSRHRPLLNAPDKRARLEELFRERDPFYREVADCVLESDREQIARFAQNLEAAQRDAERA